MKSQHTSVRTVVRGGAIALAGLFFGKLIGYIFALFATRLGASDYGLLNLGMALVSFVVIFTLIGLDQGILRYVAYYNGKGDAERTKGAILFPLKISILISIILTFFIFLFSKQISVYFFHNADLSRILRIIILSVPFITIAYIFSTALRAFKRIDYDVFTKEIAEKAVRLLFFVLLFFLGFGIIGASLSFLIASISMALLSFYLLQKVFSITGKVKPIYYNKEMLSYSFPLLLSGVFVVIIVWASTIMLIMFVFSSKIIEILFGAQYAEAGNVLSILSVGCLIYSVSYTSSNILSMIRKTKTILFITTIFVVSNIILNYFLIPILGVNGAALASSSSFLISSILFIFFCYKEAGLQPFSKEFFKAFLLGILSMLVVYSIRQLLSPSLTIIITFLLFIMFILIYFVLLFVFKIIDKEDLEIIKLIRNKVASILNISYLRDI